MEQEIEDLKNEVSEKNERIQQLEKIIGDMSEAGYDIYRMRDLQ